MNFVTRNVTESIANSHMNLDYRIQVTDEAVGYLRELLLPHARAMESDIFNNRENLMTLITRAYTGRVLRYVLTSLETFEKTKRLTLGRVKEAVIFGLLIAIIKESKVRDRSGKYITPWKIKTQLKLKENADIGMIFYEDDEYDDEDDENYEYEPSTLPVTVNINGNIYEHNMSENLVLGTLALYRLLNINHPLSMFGSNFTDFNDILGELTRNNETNGFSVVVGQDTFFFHKERDMKEFIQGLQTAALWIGVDPKQYVVNLTQLTPEPVQLDYI